MDVLDHGRIVNIFSCELEDWFHILDSDKVPPIEEWDGLTLRVERNTERLLDLLARTGVRGTFFCLGWIAERAPQLVRRCRDAGHEIGSHGYGHVLAYKVGRKAFYEDLVRSRKILEDITGEPVAGFRAPGFCVRKDSQWLFDVVVQAGYQYVASGFPARHGHGGFLLTPPEPHIIETPDGVLVEVPTTTVRMFNRRVCLFGGGYLRLSPLPLIRWGIRKVHECGQPLVVYVHPREIDPDHPRLPLGRWRRFKCYTNLRSTMPKLRWLCENYRFTTMGSVVAGLREEPEPVAAEVAATGTSMGAAIVATRGRPRPLVPVERVQFR